MPYDPTPIALTPGNILLLEPYVMALATHGLDVTVDPAACAHYLAERCGLPADQAARIVVALREMAAT